MNLVLRHMVIILVLGYLFVGFLIVAGQTIGLVTGNGSWMVQMDQWFMTPATLLSAAAAICAFVLFLP